jgi:hypothetical protein
MRYSTGLHGSLDGSGAAGFKTNVGVQQRVRMFMELGWENATCPVKKAGGLKSHTAEKTAHGFFHLFTGNAAFRC